jgi:hypothetical protein
MFNSFPPLSLGLASKPAQHPFYKIHDLKYYLALH